MHHHGRNRKAKAWQLCNITLPRVPGDGVLDGNVNVHQEKGPAISMPHGAPHAFLDPGFTTGGRCLPQRPWGSSPQAPHKRNGASVPLDVSSSPTTQRDKTHSRNNTRSGQASCSTRTQPHTAHPIPVHHATAAAAAAQRTTTTGRLQCLVTWLLTDPISASPMADPIAASPMPLSCRLTTTASACGRSSIAQLVQACTYVYRRCGTPSICQYQHAALPISGAV